LDRKNSNPDPGQYGRPPIEPTSKYKRWTTSSFGSAARFKDLNDSFKAEPGPGAYNAKMQPGADKLSFSFGSSQRNTFKQRTTQGPSPGAYEVRGKDRKGQATLQGQPYSFVGRHPPSEKTASAPGPGQYTPETKGMSQYEAAPKFGFGTSTRPPLSMPKDGPAPGQYGAGPDTIVGHITLKNNPKFSFRGKVPPVDPWTTGGPNCSQATGFG
jgi:hypothetical protein